MEINLRLVLVVVGVVLLIWLASRNREGFEATEESQPEVAIRPLLYDRETGIATTASEFVSLPDEVIPAWGTSLEEHDNDEEGMLSSLQNNMCSKSCCSQQYPPPHMLDHDAMVCANKDKFVPNDYKCNNSWQDSGCVCMTEKQKDFLARRGGNA